MSVTITGTVKTARVVDITKQKTGAKAPMLALDIVDEFGNTFDCQMWDDAPQQAQLIPTVDNMRRHPVQAQIAGYSVRMRKFQDGSERPQANFVITSVTFPQAA